MFNFFADCDTLEDVKKLYKKLCFQHHPDRGGDLETMKALNLAYEQAIKTAAWKHRKDGSTDEDVEDDIRQSQAYKEAIDKIIMLEGIVIEICGTWVWVTGDTRPVKDTLKGAGFFWAKKKEAWYFRTDENKVRNHKKMTLDQIRVRHGSDVLNRKYRPSLNSND